jgi:zinc finger protein
LYLLSQDLSRTIIKTEWAEILIPEIEFEVKKQGGLITTIEGVIDRAIEGLKETQKSLAVSPLFKPKNNLQF